MTLFGHRRRQLILLCTLILTLGSVSGAWAQGPTSTLLPPEPTLSTTPVVLTVGGTVTSGTAGVSVPAGLTLSLHVVRPGAQGTLPTEILKRDGLLGADNNFHFDNVAARPGDVVFATTSFQNVVQGSQLISLRNGQSTLDLPITLYALTNDPSVITLIRVQHILDYKPGGLLQVLATYDYKNTSDRLYQSNTLTAKGLPVSVSVPLPIGARAVAFNTQSIERFSLGGDVNAPIVQDTKPVLPGQTHEIVFSYQLPYAKGAPIDQDYPYNTSSIEVLIPDDIHIAILDNNFETAPNTSINPQRTYTQYVLKSPLKAGDRLVYTLGGAAQVATAPRPQPAASSNTLFFAFLAAAAVTLVVAVGFIAIRRRQGNPAEASRRRSRKRA
jgi:hypothetical protein